MLKERVPKEEKWNLMFAVRGFIPTFVNTHKKIYSI